MGGKSKPRNKGVNVTKQFLQASSVADHIAVQIGPSSVVHVTEEELSPTQGSEAAFALRRDGKLDATMKLCHNWRQGSCHNFAACTFAHVSGFFNAAMGEGNVGGVSGGGSNSGAASAHASLNVLPSVAAAAPQQAPSPPQALTGAPSGSTASTTPPTSVTPSRSWLARVAATPPNNGASPNGASGKRLVTGGGSLPLKAQWGSSQRAGMEGAAVSAGFVDLQTAMAAVEKQHSTRGISKKAVVAAATAPTSSAGQPSQPHTTAATSPSGGRSPSVGSSSAPQSHTTQRKGDAGEADNGVKDLLAQLTAADDQSTSAAAPAPSGEARSAPAATTPEANAVPWILRQPISPPSCEGPATAQRTVQRDGAPRQTMEPNREERLPSFSTDPHSTPAASAAAFSVNPFGAGSGLLGGDGNKGQTSNSGNLPWSTNPNGAPAPRRAAQAPGTPPSALSSQAVGADGNQHSSTHPTQDNADTAADNDSDMLQEELLVRYLLDQLPTPRAPAAATRDTPSTHPSHTVGTHTLGTGTGMQNGFVGFAGGHHQGGVTSTHGNGLQDASNDTHRFSTITTGGLFGDMMAMSRNQYEAPTMTSRFMTASLQQQQQPAYLPPSPPLNFSTGVMHLRGGVTNPSVNAPPTINGNTGAMTSGGGFSTGNYLSGSNGKPIPTFSSAPVQQQPSPLMQPVPYPFYGMASSQHPQHQPVPTQPSPAGATNGPTVDSAIQQLMSLLTGEE